MTPVGAEGTMEGPDLGSERSPDTSMQDNRSDNPAQGQDAAKSAGAPLVMAEGGVLGSRWWPARFDVIVERWVENERSARDGSSR